MDYNKRAAVGQAFNLAVHDAIKNNLENDPTYIYKKFVYYSTLSNAVQSSDLDMIKEVVNNKNFNDIIEKLTKELK